MDFNDDILNSWPATASGGFCIWDSSEGKIRHLDDQFQNSDADDFEHDDHDQHHYYEKEN